mgnify:CR=1 FL=1
MHPPLLAMPVARAYKRRNPFTCPHPCCKAKTWRQIGLEDSDPEWEPDTTRQPSTSAASLAKMEAGGSPIWMYPNSEYKDKDGKPLGIDYSDDATESPGPSRKHAKKM